MALVSIAAEVDLQIIQGILASERLLIQCIMG